MSSTKFNKALSYDSSLNYYLWKEDVLSLREFVGEIIPDEFQPSDSEINEDKLHKMFSFKLKDCTVKFYSSTNKIVIQGAGSSKLTEILSHYVEQFAETTMTDAIEIGEEGNVDDNGGDDVVILPSSTSLFSNSVELTVAGEEGKTYLVNASAAS